MPVIRSAEEIVARIELVKSNDFFGVQVGGFVARLPYEAARPYLQEGVTQEQWLARADAGTVEEEAIAYLDFAVSKIVHHRGLSASRSVDHYRVWLWLLFGDEGFAEFECAQYENYGAPQVRVAARLLGAEDQWLAAVEAHPELARMADGDPCEPGWDAGCGS